MAATSPERHVLRLIVPSPDDTRVLGRPNGLAGWGLPTIATTVTGAWRAEHSDAAERVLGGAVHPVRRVPGQAWQVEVADRLPAAGNTWIAPGEAERFGTDASTVAAWRALDEDERRHLRGGWWYELDQWAVAQLDSTGPPRFLQHWELASVALVPTAGGPVVVKEPGPSFSAEAAVISALQGLPGAPELVAVDGHRFATRWAGEPADKSLRAEVARVHGRLQRAAVAQVDALAAGGVRSVTELLSTNASALDRLRALDDLDLPASIVHTDAHAGNAVVREGQITMIDWSDPVLGCPALDLDLLSGHSGTTDEAAVVAAWCDGFDVHPERVLRALPTIRKVAASIAIALYEEHRPQLPDAFLPWWDENTQYWERRLAALSD